MQIAKKEIKQMYAESESYTGYHKKLEQQERLIREALRHLESVGVKHDFENIEILTPPESYAAWQLVKKHWQKLKQAGLDWPRKYLNHYFLANITEDGAEIINLSKGSQYTLTWIGDDNLSCTCQAYENGNDCGHVLYGLEYLPRMYGTEISANATVTIDDSAKQSLFNLVDSSLPPEHQVEPSSKAWVDDTDPRAAMLEAIREQRSTESNKNEVELLPGIIATPEQATALQDLINFANGDKAIHGLFGFAGTGKTVLLQGWLKALRESGYERPIVFTAYSNKAVNVLQSMVDRWDLDIECQTCAKLLGLKPQIDFKNGEQYFAKAYGEDSTISDYAIVVVDECSMVGSTKTHKGLWEYLTEEAGLFTKLLFVGDYAQLPPINEPISKVFLEIKEPSNLSQVKRYRGAIAEIATDLRQNLSRRAEPLFETSYTEDGGEGLFVLKQSSWLENIVKAFSSDNYNLDPNHVRCLAWTNKRIQELNQHIRRSIQGELAPRFVEGERLIAKEHFFRQKFAKQEGFPTSQEMEVIEAFEGSQSGYQCWFLTVRLFDKEGTRMCVPVLHELSQKEFERDQKDLKQSKQWKLYYEQHQQFAWVDYAYSITTHKAQGSTFKNVFVDVNDILKDKQRNTFQWPGGRKELIWERNQLLYVALTRASHRVFIYE
ncbi:MAG: AAA family ATPase [Cyanobacteria bacterium P01_C01_bin.120]